MPRRSPADESLRNILVSSGDPGGEDTIRSLQSRPVFLTDSAVDHVVTREGDTRQIRHTAEIGPRARRASASRWNGAPDTDAGLDLLKDNLFILRT